MVCGWNPIVWPFKWKLLSSTFLWYCLLCCSRWFYLLKWKSNESYWAVLSFGASSVLCCDELLSNNFFLWFSEKLGYCQRIMLIVVVFVPEKGKLFGMGDNTENQLGINQRGRTEEPILKVSVPSRIHLSTHSRASKPIQVSCGAFHTAVVTG